MNIDAIYQAACGHEPYNYQRSLAGEPWPDLLDVPTGLGKTAAVTLAWVSKRGWGRNERSPDPQTPRRLIWCLPMRVLVEQTHEAIVDWLKALGCYGEAGEENTIAVQLLMGGEDSVRGWASHPEQDQIIIGTQDMLLSRALMRGYGMSRYQWPMDFSLLHNDALWVFDEIQLMGAGLATSTQLDAFRRSLPLAHNSRSLWVSATLNHRWLNTVDFRPHLDDLKTLTLGDVDRNSPRVLKRLNAPKTLQKCHCSPESAKKADITAHLKNLAAQMLSAHAAGGPTLAVLNTVDRAQELARELIKLKPDYPLLVVHARFRAAERAELNRQIRAISAQSNELIIATQAIEAGVDLSAARLYTELAPWSSLVQRFGRCNRGGEFSQAQVHWIDLADEKLAPPYKPDVLRDARNKLTDLASAASSELPLTDEDRPAVPVLRRRDLFNLFDSDPDLSGFDVDIADYIRDNDRPPPVQVLWRDFSERPDPEAPAPHRQEMCPVSVYQLEAHLGKDKTAWRWDGLARAWQTVRSNQLRPGMTLMLPCAGGGYDNTLGFTPSHNPKKAYKLEPVSIQGRPPNAIGGDPDSEHETAVALAVHLQDVHLAARHLTHALETQHALPVETAALWHDVGKAHPVFQATLHGPNGVGPLLAKSARSGKHSRRYFRHELASALSWLSNGETGEYRDLIAYLIAAHHGKVRMSIRAWPDESLPNDALDRDARFARGICDGDELPAVQAADLDMPKTVISLEIMELGISAAGASWTSRTQQLLEQYGPFQLAWLETLVRIADWRASAKPSQTLPAANGDSSL